MDEKCKRTAEEILASMEKCPDCIIARKTYFGCDGCFDHCKELDQFESDDD